jgi:hypothetical protein
MLAVLKRKKKRNPNLEEQTAGLWCDVYAHVTRMLTVGEEAAFLVGKKTGLWCV